MTAESLNLADPAWIWVIGDDNAQRIIQLLNGLEPAAGIQVVESQPPAGTTCSPMLRAELPDRAALAARLLRGEAPDLALANWREAALPLKQDWRQYGKTIVPGDAEALAAGRPGQWALLAARLGRAAIADLVEVPARPTDPEPPHVLTTEPLFRSDATAVRQTGAGDGLLTGPVENGLTMSGPLSAMQSDLTARAEIGALRTELMTTLQGCNDLRQDRSVLRAEYLALLHRSAEVTEVREVTATASRTTDSADDPAAAESAVLHLAMSRLEALNADLFRAQTALAEALLHQQRDAALSAANTAAEFAELQSTAEATLQDSLARADTMETELGAMHLERNVLRVEYVALLHQANQLADTSASFAAVTRAHADGLVQADEQTAVHRQLASQLEAANAALQQQQVSFAEASLRMLHDAATAAATHDADLAELRTSLEKTTQENLGLNEALRQVADQHEQDFSAMARRLASEAAEKQQLQQQVEAVRAELDTVYASKSWKATARARALRRLFGGPPR